MDSENIIGRLGLQTDLYTALHCKYNTRQQGFRRRFAWLNLHYSDRHNNFKMGEGLKMILNTVGITTYILGILANINNLASVMLACVGVVWGIVKCLEKWEDYQAKKWDRLQKEEEKKKRQKLPKAS